MTTFKRILVPTDFGDCATRAVDAALSLATQLDAKATLVHVCEPPMASYSVYAGGLNFAMEDLTGLAQKALDTAVEKARAKMPGLEGVLRIGDPLEQILAAAREGKFDLIVMGTHGRRGISRALLGSVAEKTVRLASLPVLTIPAEHK